MTSESFELSRKHDSYPKSLEDLPHPPETIYGIGNPEALHLPSIAIVGSRRATPYGMAVAEIAGRVAAESGLAVISGGALGCDSAASRAALDAGGTSIIVSGCGADVIYPQTSSDVFQRSIERDGAVVSIENWGAPPRRYAFPKRNGVIAALSRATLVIEAGKKSGTMSTAEMASQLGRMLYAVPGSIFSPQSVGTNELISDGASIICSERDLEMCIALDYDKLRLTEDPDNSEMGRVMSALVASPTRADELANRLGDSVITILGTLSDYEARGMVIRLPDGRYSPSEEFFNTSDRMVVRK
ncbi:MAG: DNA-processing protein DprA [Parafannyhessea sp.]|uniref:DNA-processing protein DprA n=1 Tax=Parafannyhessea sp. TaxID=2847324 RepID=UPI003F11F0C6